VKEAKAVMTIEELDARLEAERIVELPAATWLELAPALEEVERHATGLAGDLVIVRSAGGLAAVEQPAPDARVVRRLAGADQARALVARRLDTYDKMWDGCGCKVDYRD
jgi:hypothetical protein